MLLSNAGEGGCGCGEKGVKNRSRKPNGWKKRAVWFLIQILMESNFFLNNNSFMVIGLGFVYVFNLKNTTFVLLCNNNK